MKSSTPISTTIHVEGKMSELDSGYIAKVSAWRELIRDIGSVLTRIVLGGVAIWQGGENLPAIISLFS